MISGISLKQWVISLGLSVVQEWPSRYPCQGKVGVEVLVLHHSALT